MVVGGNWSLGVPHPVLFTTPKDVPVEDLGRSLNLDRNLLYNHHKVGPGLSQVL